MSWIPAAASAVAQLAPTVLSFFGGGGESGTSYNARALKDQYNYNVKYQKSQYNYNLALQKQAQNWNEIMYKKRYQDQIADLKKAGINPLYGLGTAPAVTSSANSVGLPQAGLPDYAGEANSKRLYKLQRAQTMADLISKGISNSALMAQTQKTKQETETEKANTLLRMEQKTEVELKNAEQKLRNEKLPEMLKNEIQEQIQRIKQMKTNIQQAISQISLNYATEEYTKAGTGVKKAEKERIIKEGKKIEAETNKILNSGKSQGGITIGNLKFGWYGENEGTLKSKKGSLDTTQPKGMHYEYIRGKKVPVKGY